MPLVRWPDVERVARQRPYWKRVGREWHGPCPVTGAGRDAAWVKPAGDGGVLVGCRCCGVSLSDQLVRAHLHALVGEHPPAPAPMWKRPARAAGLPDGLFAGDVWRAAGPVVFVTVSVPAVSSGWNTVAPSVVCRLSDLGVSPLC